MKCVRHVEDKGIIRVRNDQASSLTDSGLWSYCCKQDWKREVRDVGKEEGIRKGVEKTDKGTYKLTEDKKQELDSMLKKARRTK